MKLPILLASALLATAAAGCSKGGSSSTADVPAESKQIFKDRCSSCHGEQGKGDGPAAAAFNPKPRNFTDGTWQGQVTDEQISTTIVKGGAGVGKSPLMPGNPDLMAKPDVVKGLVSMVRSLKK